MNDALKLIKIINSRLPVPAVDVEALFDEHISYLNHDTTRATLSMIYMLSDRAHLQGSLNGHVLRELKELLTLASEESSNE